VTADPKPHHGVFGNGGNFLAKHDELFVVQREDGRWAVEEPHCERASDIKNTQQQAVARAQELAPEGVINVKGVNGKFRKIHPK
jgi:Uncharacterized protein conserved in bacteria (DUF2188)